MTPPESRIHLLNGRPPKDRGSDYCTKNELMNAMMNTYGPLALTVKEIMARQQALEDHVGFVYVAPVEPEPTTDGGDPD